MSRPRLHVVAAVLRRDDHYLIQQRPSGKHMAGYWEFPGGKVEPGEAPWQALVRELDEELGIQSRQGEPLIQLVHRYPDRDIHLDVWNVIDWVGEPEAREAQHMAWHSLDSMQHLPLLPADGPVLKAMRLPHRVLVTPARSDARADFLAALARAVSAHEHQLCVLRQPELSATEYAALARDVAERLDSHSCALVLHGDPDDRLALAAELGVKRLHVPARYLSNAQLQTTDVLWSVSCHSEPELHSAAERGADFAFLGSVLPTASHPGRPSLGWTRFREWVNRAHLPVYAIGGMGAKDEVRSRLEGAQGIAAISAWW